MKTINTYINEKLVIGNNLTGYKYFPKNKDELIDCIKKKIKKEGLGTNENPLNLNDIDTSDITDMSDLFSYDRDGNNNPDELSQLGKSGYFDISDWDVSNVENMQGMFVWSKFNRDISKWDVSNVKIMYAMFWGSSFNSDISDWDVSNVENMECMFRYSKFTGKKGDITKWNTKNVKYMQSMFDECPLEDNPPKWYKE